MSGVSRLLLSNQQLVFGKMGFCTNEAQIFLALICQTGGIFTQIVGTIFGVLIYAQILAQISTDFFDVLVI